MNPMKIYVAHRYKIMKNCCRVCAIRYSNRNNTIGTF